MGVPASLRLEAAERPWGHRCSTRSKKRKRLITSLLERKKKRRKDQKTLEDERDHENILGFQVEECHVSLRAFFTVEPQMLLQITCSVTNR